MAPPCSPGRARGHARRRSGRPSWPARARWPSGGAWAWGGGPRDAEGGVVGGDDEVAREHDLEAAGQSGPVDRGDDRLGEISLGDPAEPAARPDDVPSLP